MKNKKESENQIQYMPLYMSIGISIGVAIGAATNNIPICMCLGMGIGVAIGSALDVANRKKLEKAPEEDEDESIEEKKPSLEKMSDFFEKRLDGYDEHMLTNIESATEFYPFTARLLPVAEKCSILDLGCGTGLELGEYYALNPSAKVTGIDLSKGMLDALKKKFTDKEITLIEGSYFDVPLGEEVFEAAVSVESLHHFTKEEKVPLYSKLNKALKNDGYFILTDYFALSDEEERVHRQTLNDLKAEQGITDTEFYHYDTPLTVEHEKEALLEAGFSSVEILDHWGATYTIRAVK